MSIPDRVRLRAREIEDEYELGFDHGLTSPLSRSLAVCEYLTDPSHEDTIQVGPNLFADASVVLARWALTGEER